MEDSSYLATQTQNYSDGKLKINKEIIVIPEEMLLDLADAEGIPDALVTFQSAFKLLIEQLKKLSEKASQTSSELTELAIKIRSESQDRFNRQSTLTASLLVKLLGKAINQVLVTKFESLSSGGAKDQKQIAKVMQHFIQYSLLQLLTEFQEAFKPLLGESQASEILESLREQLRDQVSMMVSLPVSISTIGILRQTRDSSSQTSQEGQLKDLQNLQMTSKAIQCIMNTPCFKSQLTQTDDSTSISIEQKKIDLLIKANKSLSEQLKVFKDKTSGLESSIESFQQESIFLKMKLQEAADNQAAQRLENEKLRTSLEQKSREIRLLMDRATKAEDSIQLTLIETSEKGKKDIQEMNLQLQEVSRQAAAQLDSMRKQVGSIKDELEIEKKANFQLQERLAQEIQSVTDLKSYIQTQLQENSGLKHEIEAKNKIVLSLQQEIKNMKDQTSEQTEAWMREKDILEKKLNAELSDSEQNKLLEITNLNNRLLELSTESAKKEEIYNQKLKNLSNSVAKMDQELDAKDKMIRELQATNNILVDEKNTMASQLEMLRNEFHNEKRHQEVELDRKTKQEDEFKRLKEKVNESGYRMRDLEKENNSLKELRVGLVAKIEELQEKLSQAHVREKELKELIEEKEELHQKKEGAHQLLIESLEKAREGLTAELKQSKKETEEIKIKFRENEEIRLAQISSYEKEINSLSKNRDDENTNRNQFAVIEDELAKKTIETLQLKHLDEENKRKIKELSDLLDVESRKVFTIEDAFKKVVDENAHLTNSLKASADKLKDQSANLDQQRSEKLQLETANEKLTKELERLKADGSMQAEVSSKLSKSLEEIENLRHEVAQKERHNEELTNQLKLVDMKASERSSVLKKAKDDLQSLEKEVIELRPMKTEVLNLSIALSKLREELQTKDKSANKHSSDLESLKTQLAEKIKDHESLALKFKKTLEDFKRLQDQSNHQHEEEKKQIQTTLGQEIAALKASNEELLVQTKERFEAELKLKSEKIDQLTSTIDRQHKTSESEKNAHILDLEAKLKKLQDVEQQLLAKQSSELAVMASKFKEEVAAVKQKAAVDLEKALHDSATYEKKMSELAEHGRQRTEEIAMLKSHLEEASRAIKESDQKLVGLKELVALKEKDITTMIEQNQVLTNTLKMIKRQQSSVPKVQSSSKHEPSAAQNHPPVPTPHGTRIVISSSTERRVENNLITNFEKHLTNNNSSTGFQNPIAQYLNNKENTDVSNHNHTLPTINTVQVKRYTEEEYQKVLIERKLANEMNSQSSSTLKPPIMNPHSSGKPLAMLSPSKKPGLLASSIGGLHILPEDDVLGDNGDGRGDDVARGYSSRYSRHSRTSRNSRRSPTPSKEHSSVH